MYVDPIIAGIQRPGLTSRRFFHGLHRRALERKYRPVFGSRVAIELRKQKGGFAAGFAG